MSSTESPLMQMLSTQMRYLTQRQTVLSQNIANIDTPGYKSRDMKKLDFSEMASQEQGRLGMRATSPKHLSGMGGGGAFATQQTAETFETTPVKNNVGLEEEMAKISQTGADYQVASSMYKKFTQLYRSALGNR